MNPFCVLRVCNKSFLLSSFSPSSSSASGLPREPPACWSAQLVCLSCRRHWLISSLQVHRQAAWARSDLQQWLFITSVTGSILKLAEVYVDLCRNTPSEADMEFDKWECQSCFGQSCMMISVACFCVMFIRTVGVLSPDYFVNSPRTKIYTVHPSIHQAIFWHLTRCKTNFGCLYPQSHSLVTCQSSRPYVMFGR